MADWSPMEAAPKSGRDILVYCKDTDEMFVAFWNKNGWQYASKDGITFVCHPDYFSHLPNPPIEAQASL